MTLQGEGVRGISHHPFSPRDLKNGVGGLRNFLFFWRAFLDIYNIIRWTYKIINRKKLAFFLW